MKYSRYEIKVSIFNKVHSFERFIDDQYNLYKNRESILSDKFSESFELIDIDEILILSEYFDLSIKRNSIIYV